MSEKYAVRNIRLSCERLLMSLCLGATDTENSIIDVDPHWLRRLC